ncbi:response regulator [Marinomonas sp.]|uniref:response regulator n=1 Tax=Marinomonas sp. TaxID=1904862 RepID=UPI003BAC625E
MLHQLIKKRSCVCPEADSSTTRLYGGTGLGLSITQKLVNLLGGHISYESALGEGCIFKIKLPYHPDLKLTSAHIENVTIFEEDVEIVSLFLALGASHISKLKLADLPKKSCSIIASHHFLTENGGFLKQLKGFDNKILILNGKSSNASDYLELGLVTPTSLHNIIAILNSRCDVVNNKVSNEKVKDNEAFFKGKSILLAEDNKINASIVKAIIEKIGASVDWVENGKEAYEMSLSHSYDLILMDIRMPIMDGYEASEKITADLRYNKPPIIFLTADNLNLKKESVLRLGIDDVLFKPLDPYLLIEKVQHWIVEYSFTSLVKKTRVSSTSLGDKNIIYLKSKLEELEVLLEDGDSDSEALIKKIIEKRYNFCDIDILKSAVEDIASYDYQDAMMKVRAFKRGLI